jgi:hypothetical protein
VPATSPISFYKNVVIVDSICAAFAAAEMEGGMKLRSILAAVASLFVVAALASSVGYAQDAGDAGGTGVSTSKSKGGTKPAVAQTAHQKAMATCETYYGGRRGNLGADRYAYIELCFKNATGMYPAQAKLNCSFRRC